MEAFKERMIAEYVELDERTNKLDEFILKNPKFNEIPSEQKPLMYAQMNAMDDYRQNLRARMSLLGITNDDIAAYKHPYQNLSFGEALQALEAGKCVARKGWITTCFVVKQIDSDIPAEVVPKMQSLPQHAKNLLNAFGVGSISYRSQCLLVEQAGDGNGATNYVPDWVDMFEKFYAGFCAAKTELKIGTPLYVVVAHEQWFSESVHSENKAVFMQYRNAIAYVNSLPENYKVSYDIEEIICGDE